MNRYARLLSAAAFGVMSAAASGSWGQSLPPPPELNLDVNGVDVRTGQPTLPTQTISIGPEGAGVARTSTRLPKSFEDYWFTVGITPGAYSGNGIRFMGTDYIFGSVVGNVYKSVDNTGFEYECSTADIQNLTDCELYLKDGTIGYFTPKTIGVAPYTYVAPVLSKIVKPDGETIRINTVAGGANNVAEVQSVVSSLGWMLKYTSDAWGTNNVTALNLANEYCSPTSPCGTFANVWPSLNVSGEGQDLEYGGATFYDVAGKATNIAVERAIVMFNNEGVSTWEEQLDKHIITSPAGRTKTIKYYSHELDGQNNWQLTGPPEALGTVYYVLSGGVKTEYNYGVPAGSFGSVTGHWAGFGNFVVDFGPCDYGVSDGSYMQVADATGAYEMYKFKPIKVGCSFAFGRLYYYRDKLNRITTYDYDAYARITKITHPELNYESYEYDTRGNVTKITHTAKPGSGLAARVESAGYESGCANRLTCNKPLWVRDAVGNEAANIGNALHRTDYEYYSGAGESGGVKSITYPPDQNGVRRKERFFYQQFQPTLYTSPSSTGAGQAVWRVIRKETCASTVANCTGAADEKVLYEYNHNNRVLTAEITAAGNADPAQAYSTSNAWRKTTYSYDIYGNRTGVDGPRTDVDDISYTTYDVMRRKVFEIGPDPDGGGALKRPVIRHVYDFDGLETETQTGTYNNTNGAAFALSQFAISNPDSAPYTIANKKRMTYDGAGRLTRTEVVVP
jgi:YD repeat-containing protein